MSIGAIDWVVIGGYLAVMVAFGLWLARKTKSGDDYYLAGRGVPPLIAAASIMATQTSTNSLIGAPAFVALQPDYGGLRYLQFELALPLSMIVIMVLIVPMLWRSGAVTIYEFLERRFDLKTRLILSGVFLLSRALATGVTVYATAQVLAVATGAQLWVLVAIIGGVCLIYSTLGGLVADVWTDAVQLVVLWGCVFLSIAYAVSQLGSMGDLETLAPARAMALDFSSHGLGDGAAFGFWPMLIGGAFLYASYYGTDQTQVQRLLAAPSVSSARKSLFINGLMRFPLVLSYALLGVSLAALLRHSPQFQSSVTEAITVVRDGVQTMERNRLVPVFIVNYLPPGIVGVMIAGMLAATMSSLDSTFNSLSAATMRDFIERFGWVTDPASRRYVLVARGTTFAWGIICSAFAFVVGDISPTVVEGINKVGSLTYGPVLAVFVIAFATRWIDAVSAISGLFVGVIANILLWKYVPSVAWPWWNVTGFLVSISVSALMSLPRLQSGYRVDLDLQARVAEDSDGKDRLRYSILVVAALVIAVVSWGLGRLVEAPAI